MQRAGATDDRWWTSPWTHAALLGAVTLVVLSRYGIAEYPITNDRAYFIYIGQAVLRGEPYYSTTFMGYPPLGALLSAASMWVGEWFGVPTYLAPRYLGVAVGTASVALTYVFTRTATGSAWPGILAGIVLAGFAQLGGLTVSNLEPKSLVILFTLVAGVALQRRWWGWAGVAAGLAATCWQPAGLIPVACVAVVLWGGRPRSWAAMSRCVAGGILASVPSVLYLTRTQSWQDFWQRSVVLPAASQLPRAGSSPLYWLDQVHVFFPTEIIFLYVATAGFVWFTLQALRGGIRSLVSSWLDPRLGGVPLLTLAWAGFNSVEFGVAPDLLPMLPLAAFWVGWIAHRAVEAIAAARALRPRVARAVSHAAIASLLVCAPIYAFTDAFRYYPAITLSEQLALVRRITAPAGKDGLVMAVRAEEVYVLGERRSPNRFLRLDRPFVSFLHLIDPRGCGGVVDEVLARRPAVVVMRLRRYASRCEEHLKRRLLDNHYEREMVTTRERLHKSFRPHDRHAWVNRWFVFTDARR